MNSDLASLALADAIGEHDFSLRERRVLEVIRRLSFAAGRTEAYIPRTASLAAAAAMSEGNARTVLAALKGAQVIEETPKDFYGIKLPAAFWQVPPALDLAAIRALALELRPDHLQGALRAEFLSNPPLRERANVAGATASETVTPGARSVTETPAATFSNRLAPGKDNPTAARARGRVPNRDEARPESGPQAAPGASRIGTRGGKNAEFIEVMARPESGRGAGLQLQPCKIVSGTEQCLNKVATTSSSGAARPESGPHMDRHGRSLRLNAECQALVDELRACGAITQERFSTAVWLAFVRARPGVVAELLGELRYAQARYQVGNPGAWMMDKWRRWGRPDQ